MKIKQFQENFKVKFKRKKKTKQVKKLNNFIIFINLKKKELKT